MNSKHLEAWFYQVPSFHQSADLVSSVRPNTDRGMSVRALLKSFNIVPRAAPHPVVYPRSRAINFLAVDDLRLIMDGATALRDLIRE